MDEWFTAYLDDASRFVVGYGLFIQRGYIGELGRGPENSNSKTR